jgi:carbonic anhydrase
MSRIRTLLGALLIAAVPAAAGAQSPAWSYHGETGPAHWGKLSPDYAACDTGTRQSPISLPAAGPAAAMSLSAAYGPVSGPLYNNGHTVQMNVGPGSVLTLEGRRYTLLQFHFHRPAENLVHGRRYAAEVHLVHQDSTGALAVLATFITAGARDTAWTTLLAALPTAEGDTAKFSGPVDLARLLHVRDLAGERVRTFAGSLTTPRCSQGVTWLVRERPIHLSAEQIRGLRAAVAYSARPVQPRNDRTVARVVPPVR